MSNNENLTEISLESRELHRNHSFSFFSDRVKLPDGRDAIKDYVVYPEAVGIVAYADPETILLIEQYRYPVRQTLFEIPAGKMEDPEETRLEAAQRELLEETGYRARSFDYLFSYFPCPGYSTEKLHLFRASEITLEGQFLDEDEFIRVIQVPLAEAYRMIAEGKIQDSKTLLALMYLKNK